MICLGRWCNSSDGIGAGSDGVEEQNKKYFFVITNFKEIGGGEGGAGAGEMMQTN